VVHLFENFPGGSTKPGRPDYPFERYTESVLDDLALFETLPVFLSQLTLD
jgi:hypothetical protein